MSQISHVVGIKENVLSPCWVAGEQKLPKTRFRQLFDSQLVKSLDISDCCEQIQNLISKRKTTNPCHGSYVPFKDIVRLTFGVSFIHKQQVSCLLDDTKHLLDQINGNNFVAHLLPNKSFFKRKLVTTEKTTTTVSVSKRVRVQSPQFLGEECVEYYKNMLTETLLNNEAVETLNIVKTHTTCISENIITIKQGVLPFDSDQNQQLNEGFGDTNQMDQTFFEEFVPIIRSSLKRKSPDHSSINVSSFKKPRLEIQGRDTANCCEAIELVPNIDPQESLAPIEDLPLIPPPPISSRDQFEGKSKRLRKKHLKIDKSIKLSRQKLLENRVLLNTSAIQKRSLKISSLSEILHSFRQSNRFPDRLKKTIALSSEQKEDDCELTIRAIFAEEYTEEISREILRSLIPISLNNSIINITTVREAPETTDNPSPTSLILQHSNNNNETNINNDSDFDSHSTMMALLCIWRKHPQQKFIDANKFIKSYPDRIKAALAFSHLLSLAGGNFLELSTKKDSLEIDTISLGTEAIRLIENASNS